MPPDTNLPETRWTQAPSWPADHPLLADLTEPQREAVVTTEGPVLVLAAAGSGKTRVITRRVAFLINELGIAPWQVLAITFTNKAAGEMRDRVGQLVSGRQARAVTVGTFHALCARLLREYADRAKLPADYSIYDTSDQQRAVKDAMEQLNITTRHFQPGAVLATISNAKNQLVDAATYEAHAGDFFQRSVARIYSRYQQILERNGAVDFDDMLLKTAQLLQRDEQARTELQERYQYLLIDEYQDTNHAQFVIANALAAKHQNICVVGDPDQSIYGWRGANIRNILDFEEHFPTARVIELGQNYRSTPQILQAADALIRNNQQRRHKPLWTENGDGDRLEIVQASEEEHEAQLVIEWFKQRHEEGVNWDQMAVFYRINALSRVMEEAMLRANIPYQIARGTAFYQRKEVKDAIAYLKFLANSADDISMMRIVNTPTRGIGDTTVKHLQAWAVANGTSTWEAMERAGQVQALNSRAVTAVSKFVSQVQKWRAMLTESGEQLMLGGGSGVQRLVEAIVRDSGLEAHYKKDDEEKLANLYELINAAQRFDEEYGEEDADTARRLRDYLESVSLVSDVDGVKSDGGAVTLMTLHAAKGLEFPVVAMVGLEEGLLPHARSHDDPSELEEERRLCFVGITRAQQRLMLCHARYRTVRGLRERTIPSQFLRELPEEVVERKDFSGYDDEPWQEHADAFDDMEVRMPGGSWRPKAQKAAGAGGLEVGVRVRHPQFGLGRVVSLVPANTPSRAKVHFDRAGTKTLILEYARLERVE